MSWVTLFLPPAPKELSPNARVDRWTKAAAAKEYRRACYVLGVAERNKTPERYPFKEPITMRVAFFLNSKRRRDLDNLIAAFKPGLDGLVDAGLISDDNVWVLSDQRFVVLQHRQPAISVTFEELAS